MTQVERPTSIAEVLAPGEGQIRVTACPHPFRTARVDLAVEAGMTVADIFAQAQPDAALRRHAHIFVGDQYIPRENWRLVRPKPGATVSIRVVPTGGGGGGGGKNPLRTVLMIAVLAAAAVVSGGALGPAGFIGGFGPAFAAGGAGAIGLASGIPLIGEMAVNQERAPA